MGQNMIIAAAAALMVGVVLFFSSSKQRQEDGEWSSGLQWGYLLVMVGVFGLLSTQISLTAVLLLFVLLTGTVWVWQKLSAKQARAAGAGREADGNHFRDYIGGFFPLILVVFVLRTFVAEPFQIPSSSMRPGLVVGDFILVNKFAYGIRTPVVNNVLVPVGQVERGDVVVFNYPPEPSLNYVKRVVGLPGDEIVYKDKILTVNGKVEQTEPSGMYAYPDDQMPGARREAERFRAQLDGRSYEILRDQGVPAVYLPSLERMQQEMAAKGFDSGVRDHCRYEADGSGFSCTVPPGKYFALGDNRDNSADSRYWGFVDDRLVVGKAFFVWMNLGELSRIGNGIR